MPRALGASAVALSWIAASSATLAADPSTLATSTVELLTPFADKNPTNRVTTPNSPSSVTNSDFVPLTHGTCGPLDCSASADGAGAASASFGPLGASASGNALSTEGAASTFDVSSTAEWLDFGVPTSSTLPNGSAVSLEVDMFLQGNTDLHGSIESNLPVAVFQSGVITFTGDSPTPQNSTLVGRLCGSTDLAAVYTPPGCGPIPLNAFFEGDLSVMIDLVVGQSIGIEGQLEVIAAGTASAAGGSLSGSADGTNAATFVLKPLDDFTLVTASGHDYSTAPEPGSLALGAVGLLGVGTLRVSRRR